MDTTAVQRNKELLKYGFQETLQFSYGENDDVIPTVIIVAP